MELELLGWFNNHVNDNVNLTYSLSEWNPHISVKINIKIWSVYTQFDCYWTVLLQYCLIYYDNEIVIAQRNVIT